jgi:hypothetical protein
MIKLINLLKEITEAKQVGNLYHFTNDLEKILQTNLLKATSVKNSSTPLSTVSFTRTPHRTFDIARYSDSVLVIDGDKLSNKYKISPFKDPKVDWEDEMEERVFGDIPNIDQYIIKVILFEDEYDEDVIPLLKEKNTPYEIKPARVYFDNED